MAGKALPNAAALIEVEKTGGAERGRARVIDSSGMKGGAPSTRLNIIGSVSRTRENKQGSTCQADG